MSEFLLLNNSLNTVNEDKLIDGFLELKKIPNDKSDCMVKNDEIYATSAYLTLCSYKSQYAQFILDYLEQSFKSESCFSNNDDSLISYFGSKDCGFMGIDFRNLEVSENRSISNEATYIKFKQWIKEDMPFRDFWQKRTLRYPRLIFCDSVQEQVEGLGDSPEYNQIITQMDLLNNSIENWNIGEFPLHEIILTSSLDISPESDQTLIKFGQCRRFKIPERGRELFSLHIKTGNFRIYIYPNSDIFRVYVGYVGAHLPIVTSK